MTAQLVTIAVVPRERFSFTQRSLESVYNAPGPPFNLIYVDGGSPPPVRDYLQRQAAKRAFRLIRTEQFLTPNEARNLAAAHVRTKYVVFIDNDLLVSPLWLQTLVNCAEETGAWVVGPVYCEKEPAGQRIHMAGGSARFVERRGRRIFQESHLFCGQPLADVRPTLRRQPTEMIEFHCALLRMEVFSRLGPLDPGLMSAAEHTDLCLSVREAGEAVYLEPDSIVTYVPPPPLEKSDLPYFLLRWGHAWNVATIERFREKWGLDANDPGLAQLMRWLGLHRRLALHSVHRALRIFGRRPARLADQLLLAPIEQAVNRLRFPAGRVTVRPPVIQPVRSAA